MDLEVQDSPKPVLFVIFMGCKSKSEGCFLEILEKNGGKYFGISRE